MDESEKKKIEDLRSGKVRAPKENDFWNDEDDATLKKKFYENMGITEMAILLGRTEVSICNRIMIKGYFDCQSKRRNRESKKKKDECPCIHCERKDCEHCGLDCYKKKGQEPEEKAEENSGEDLGENIGEQ